MHELLAMRNLTWPHELPGVQTWGERMNCLIAVPCELYMNCRGHANLLKTHELVGEHALQAGHELFICRTLSHKHELTGIHALIKTHELFAKRTLANPHELGKVRALKSRHELSCCAP